MCWELARDNSEMRVALYILAATSALCHRTPPIRLTLPRAALFSSKIVRVVCTRKPLMVCSSNGSTDWERLRSPNTKGLGVVMTVGLGIPCHALMASCVCEFLHLSLAAQVCAI